MEKNLKLLGKIIKVGRKKKKMTQFELSKKIFLSECYITDLERGRTTPSVDVLFRLISCLNIDVNPFFYDLPSDNSELQELQRLLSQCNTADYKVLISTATALIEQKHLLMPSFKDEKS